MTEVFTVGTTLLSMTSKREKKKQVQKKKEKVNKKFTHKKSDGTNAGMELKKSFSSSYSDLLFSLCNCGALLRRNAVCMFTLHFSFSLFLSHFYVLLLRKTEHMKVNIFFFFFNHRI